MLPDTRILELDETVAALDLSPIKETLTRSNGENQWSPEQVEIAELWYKRFLHLKKRYPHQRLVPRKFIDEFWHTHILDTQKYADDCERVFGSFLHHYPYFGLNGADDVARWNNTIAETDQLFRREFCETCDDVEFPPTLRKSNDRINSYCQSSCSNPCSDGMTP